MLSDADGLDPVMEAAYLAPLHPGLALVPEVGTARTEPLRVSTMLATLDFVSHGLAGWLVLPDDDDPARAAEHVDVVRALWDSWEDGAEIRDAGTHRFLDREKLHETLDAGGQRFAIRGPSITPRPPQGQLPLFARVDDEASLAFAASLADVALTTDPLWGHRAREAGLAVLEQGGTGVLHGVWSPDPAHASRPPRSFPRDQPVRLMRQIHLAAHFPGVNNTTVWSDPASGSHIELDSFVEDVQLAERGLFDAFFLAEGLSLRHHGGHVHDLDVVGRPDSFTILAALAAVTERIGLMATLTTTYHHADQLARQLATLDHLSAGRAGWNLVTSTDAVTGENFTTGAHVPYADRYVRATEVLETAGAYWTEHPIPGRRPVILQAGDSSDGREFAAQHADGIFTRHGSLEKGQAFYNDVKGRLGRYGKTEDDLLVMPGATFVLGDTDEEAAELALEVRRAQISGPTAMVVLEQLWNRDLSAYDPDGPLPDVDPHEGEPLIAPGSIPSRMYAGKRQEVADQWRARAQAEGLSIRELVIANNDRQSFVGSPATVAAEVHTAVQERACDGFILVPHITPGGLRRFAEEVVPLLQERGSFRTAYPEDATLRGTMGLG